MRGRAKHYTVAEKTAWLKKAVALHVEQGIPWYKVEDKIEPSLASIDKWIKEYQKYGKLLPTKGNLGTIPRVEKVYNKLFNQEGA